MSLALPWLLCKGNIDLQSWEKNRYLTTVVDELVPKLEPSREN